jgi:pimeloyl-ACP methyl ester carboxylesterase
VTARRGADAVPSHLVAGEGDPPLLLLHGIGGGAGVWAGTIDHLAPSHRTVAWTMPGYADSPPLPQMTWPALAGAAVGLLDHLDLPTAVVVGHSFGGMVAQEMALLDPDRVTGLVLVGTVAAFGGGSPEFVERYLADRLAPLDAGRSPADFAGATITSLVAAPLAAADHERAVSAMAAISPDAYRAALTCLTTWDRRDRIGEIAVPTLVVAGEVDPIAPPKAVGRLAEGIPGARSVVVPATGHLVNLESPAAFHDALDAWLADLAVPA